MGNYFFESVQPAPADPILSMTAKFMADLRPSKVNLSVGLYFDEQLRTPIMKAVKTAEERLLFTEKAKDYLSIEGDFLFIEGIAKLVFGSELWSIHQKKIVGFQAPGGTGAIRIGVDFLSDILATEAAIPNPSWPNHKAIFRRVGLEVKEYPYYDFQNHNVVFDQMVAYLKKLPPHTVVVLHTCCHNPTGADIAAEQWHILSKVCLEARLFPFFDFAYQGFSKGLDEDAFPIRLFLEHGHAFAVAASQSKNFGLYGERCGALYVVCNNPRTAQVVSSKVKVAIRALYSNPPRHGALIAAMILNDPILQEEWSIELAGYRTRLQTMRTEFVKQLSAKIGSKRFSYLLQREGFFCYTGLTAHQVAQLQNEYGIYMIGDGRINVAGLTADNLDFVSSAIVAMIKDA